MAKFREDLKHTHTLSLPPTILSGTGFERGKIKAPGETTVEVSVQSLGILEGF